MYLYVISNDHGDRESCNIFYSGYIITQEPIPEDVVAKFGNRTATGGKDFIDILFKGVDEEDDEYYDEYGYVTRILNENGIQFELADIAYLIAP